MHVDATKEDQEGQEGGEEDRAQEWQDAIARQNGKWHPEREFNLRKLGSWEHKHT